MDIENGYVSTIYVIPALKSYYKYRAAEKIETFAGDSLTAMDACAYELEGDIEKANILFSGIAQTCTDYHVLENVLRFYKRSRCSDACYYGCLRLPSGIATDKACAYQL